MLTMAPDFVAIMPGRTARQVWKVPLTWTANMRAQSSSVMSSTAATW